MIFLGKRPQREGASGPGKVYIINEANISIRPLSHETSVQVSRFGDGFAWGYHGAGPSQLALALLLETTNDEELSCSLCSSFKVDFIAEVQADCVELEGYTHGTSKGASKLQFVTNSIPNAGAK